MPYYADMWFCGGFYCLKERNQKLEGNGKLPFMALIRCKVET